MSNDRTFYTFHKFCELSTLNLIKFKIRTAQIKYKKKIDKRVNLTNITK